jgi:hypothetical protein
MSDVRRLLNTTDDEHEIERALLGGLRDLAPPPEAKAETWTRLQARLAGTAAAAAGAVAAQHASQAAIVGTAPAGPASTLAGPAASMALRSLALKVGLGVLVAGSMTAGTLALWPRRAQTAASPTVMPSRAEPAAATVPLDPEPRIAPPLVTLPPDKRTARARRPEPATAPDPLREEAAMITAARAELRSGEAHAALVTLDRLQSRSRNGVLGQEREILTVQALSALGEADEARRRARAFVARYPDSPHAAQMRGIAQGP